MVADRRLSRRPGPGRLHHGGRHGARHQATGPGGAAAAALGRQPYAPPPAPHASVAASADAPPSPQGEPMAEPGGADRQRRRQIGQVLAAVPLFLAAPLLRPWHTRWGSTDAEV